MPQNEISEEVLEEGCYFLTKLGLSREEIARHFELDEGKVDGFASSYASKLESGTVITDSFDLTFWEDVKKEAEGDTKLTFVSDKGFHHSWKSELRKLDGPALMSIYESSRDFLSTDVNQRFLDYSPPKGYDPLAMEREVRKAVQAISSMLEEKWKEEKSAGGSKD